VRLRCVVVALSLLACLTRPSIVPQTFSIDAPVRAGAACEGAPVLALRRVEVASEIDSPHLVYRLKDHRLERDPYATLAAPPGDVLTQAIRAYLRSAGVARDVVEPGSAIPPDWIVDVYASDLSGDFTRNDPAAVIALQFRVLPATGSGAPVLDKTYVSRRVIPGRTASAVVAAWNAGLAEIMAAFARDISSLPATRDG
jgi:uncharacterized lipoprotein YmbA